MDHCFQYASKSGCASQSVKYGARPSDSGASTTGYPRKGKIFVHPMALPPASRRRRMVFFAKPVAHDSLNQGRKITALVLGWVEDSVENTMRRRLEAGGNAI